jgi:cytochrome c-type biogenesis protein CcmH|tara:strand:- start:33 stop:407 length:375 start_codon:yes stop_codon:yes gene_type:complete
MKKIIFYLLILNLLSLNSVMSQNFSQLEIKIFKNIRCLVCQGQSIADSNSDFAQTIKSVVSDKISQGKNEKEIYNFLSSKYGDWIVYKPSLNIPNLMLWVIPYLFVIFGVMFFLKNLRKKRQNK